GRAMPIQEADRAEQKCASADRGVELRLWGDAAQPLGHGGALQLAVGRSTRNEEQIDGWMVLEGVVRLDMQIARRAQQAAFFRDGEDPPLRRMPTLSTRVGRALEGLVWSAEVKLLDLVIEEDPDMKRTLFLSVGLH